jgi:superoxide dismutase, Cu-Zn family
MKVFFSAPKPLLYILSIASVLMFSCNSESSSSTPAADTSKMAATDNTTNHTMASMPDTASVPMVNHAEASMAGTYADTIVTGTVKFDVIPNGKVKMVLEILIPYKAGKSVAVHIHEHGDCSDTAMMAHGHWNPTHANHGKWGSASFHSGDIGNVKLNSIGKGTLTITTDLWTLGGMADKNILGRSIIIHGGMDDYTTQPSGNSGTRIGCGVIK